MKRKERKKQSKNMAIQSKQLQPHGVSINMETSWVAQELKSNLSNMARFQQKQLQEKEQKLLQLYDQQQQRAYQVVQRGSAGSNGSNHTATISQHTVTKTSSSSHTTSTSQGGKVRQMFDERRQTTVKGIDRSYPLEPLENKPRKQANGNSVQKNGNLTVNRQSVTARRVARADVNSNLNGGKPVVSYHEEITRESFGPSARQHQGDDEFGNENHVGRYTNGNHRDGMHIEEILDEDMIERNRMMAKLHLMEYDESLKHRVKNDLESEEFPEDFMVDVPDKLPKQSVTKKLSQAEARLERFKNANVKRGSYVTKNPTTAPKKRSDPIFPAKSTSSEDRATKAGSYEIRSDRRKKGPASNELRVETLIPEITGETLSPDSARYVRRRDDNPRFFCKESEKSATTYAIDAKKLSPELSKDRMQRSDRSRSFTVSGEFEKYPTDLNVTRTSTFKSLKDGVRGKQSPKLFSKDAGKSTASSAIDLKNVRKLPSEMSKDVKERSESLKYFCKESEKSATARAIDPKSAERLIQEVSKVVKDVKRRSESPKFFCKESEKSATAYAIDPKTADKSTRVSLRDMKDVKSPSESPAFFCKESEKSATTYAVEPKTTKRFSAEGVKDIKKRGESPKYFGKESGKPATTHAIDPRATKKFSSGSLRDTKDRTDGPKFFCKESEKSATTYAVDSRSPSVSPDSTKNRESSLPKMEKSQGKKDTIKESMNDRIKRHIKSLKHDAIKRSTFPKYLKHDANHPRGSKSTPPKSSSFPTRECSSSPHFFFREGRKSTRKKSTDDQSISRLPNFSERNIKKRGESPRIASITDAVKSKSPDFAKISCRKSSTSPQYLSDSDRSTTFMMVTPKTITKPRTEFAYSKSREQSPALSVSKSENAVTGVPAEPKRNDSSMESYDQSSRQFIRSSVSRFFSEQCEKATRNADVRKHVQSAKIGKKGYSSRGSSPLSLKDMRTPSPTKPQFYRGRTEKADRRTSVDTDSSRDSSPKYRKIVDSGEETPGFVRRETEQSAATAGLEPRVSRNVIKGSPQGPKSIKQAVLREISTKTKNLLNNVKNKSRSPHNLTAKDSNSTSKDKNMFNRRGSGNTLRSTKLTRDAAKGNSTTKSTNLLNRRGSSNALCSTKLIRDALKRQNGRNRALLATEKSRSEISSDRVQEVTTVNKRVDERAGTSTVGELSAARSSLRSCTSAEMDTDVRGIVMSDECIKQEKLRGTYSRSSNKTAGGRPGSEKLFTYSVRKPVKRRGSLLGSNMFERLVKNSREEKPTSSRYKSPNASLQREETVVGSIKSRTKGAIASKKSERNTLRSEGRTAGSIQSGEKNMTSSKPCRTQSINRDPKRRIEGNANRRSETKISRVVGGQTSSPFESQEEKGEVNSTENSLDETKETKTLSEQLYILKSVSLVQNVTKEPDFTEKSRKLIRETIADGTENQITKSGPVSSTIDIREPELIVVSIPSSKNYERTDSVESALRRFDSIGMETGSIRGTWKRSAESIAEKIQTKSGETGSTDDSRTISLGALDRPEAGGKGRRGKPRGTSEMKNAQKKLEGTEDSMEMTRIALRSRSPSCRRKLFQNGDSDDSETRSTASRCSLDSTRTVKHLSALFDKNETPGSMNVQTASKRFKFSASNETLTEMTDKGEADQVSTGVDRSVKQLRSIEDIRRSIEDESPDRKRGRTSAKSAIVGNALRDLSVAKATARSVPRRINIDDRAGNRKEISLPRRSGNVTASNDALGDTGRSSVKCTMRFSRVAKSPSPETTKATETSSRARRTVPAPPSKSPDTVARRPSTELKAQDTKSTRRPTPMKGTEPTGNRKMTTTTTSASTKKSTDVVDGAFLENGLHLRDQTAETKYDNDSLTTKKNDAFVIDFDEQPPKENDAPLPRKSLLRKQSTEKQIASAQSARPPLSVSSTSSGSSMQGQTSGLKSKMASRAKTPISGSTSYKGSASSKTGSAATDALVPCKMCGRRFAQDRITLHEQICTKMMQKKRKQFDTMMYRVKGTDLEPFVKKGLAKKQLEKSKKPEVKSNWRRKHEDFINAIRSAKQVQAHLAAGGKLSDLPPPPVSDNCDYIQCPHCGRKFNKAAAERHIPKCEHMLHNKPIHSRAPKPKR